MSASTGALLTSYCWSLQHRLTCIIDAHSLALAMAQSAGPHHTTAERISAHHARHTCSYTRGTLATEEATPSVPPLTLLPPAASAAPLTMAALSCPGHPQAARPQCQLCRRPVGQVEWIGLHATLARGYTWHTFRVDVATTVATLLIASLSRVVCPGPRSVSL